jgi:phosphatidylglycerol---prolipoprotein diacylglyceryl transferase
MVSIVSALAAIGWKVLDRFHIGDSFAISPHGVGIAIGFLAGAYVLVFEGRKRGISEETSSTLVFWALIGTIVGARGFYVLGHYSEFNGDVGEMLAVWKGGLTLVGGIFGAVIFAYPLMRRHKVRFLQGMDSAAIGLPLGIVIGRIGDLIIGDHLGKPTSWLLAFQYHGGNLSGYDCSILNQCRDFGLSGGQIQTITTGKALLSSAGGQIIGEGVGVHQTALYDFVSAMLLVLFILWLNRKPRRTGILIVTFATWYGIGRIIEDFLRVDKRFFGLTGSQWASVAVVAISVVSMVWWATHPQEAGRPGGDGGSDAGEAGSDSSEAERAPAG